MKLETNNKKHITNKLNFYADTNENKLDNIKYVCFTKSLTCGVDF